MKLYDTERAPNPRRVRWFMAEKGIDEIEVVPVSIMAGEHKAPDYRAKVGLPVVPVLELDDGGAISESVAICRYLESLHPEPNLFGRDPRETAMIEMWGRRAEFMLANPLMLAVRHGLPALAVLEQQVPALADSSRAAAERGLDTFERQLGVSEFIAGDRITIADIIAICGLDFARLIKFVPAAELASVTRWATMMRARPAAAAAR